MKKTLFLLVIIFSFFTQIIAQQTVKISAFLDCSYYCDNEYIQTEINFVNFIREPKNAQVHVIVSKNITGSGGDFFNFRFIGQHEFSYINDTLELSMNPDATDEKTRVSQVEILKKGLLDFVKHTSISENISIIYNAPILKKEIEQDDPWSNWIFAIYANGYLRGEDGYKSEETSFRFSANKITKDIKLRNSIFYNLDKTIFDYDDIKLTTIQKNALVNILAVSSINNHISIGAKANYQHSTYSNINHGMSLMPAIEYNIFPYSEATEHQLRILYEIGNQRNNYIDTTIFFKTYEDYFFQQLSINYESMQKWGNIDLSLTAKDLFLEGNKYNVYMYLSLNIRITKGLSINGWTSINFNRSQIELPATGSNYEEIILRQRQLESNYNYYTSIGLSYTFGSLFNNIVNTRFD